MSSILKKLEDSTKVEIIIANMPGNNCILNNNNNKIDDKKNAVVPSRVFSKIFTFPYFWPIIAAIESEMLIISNERIAISLGKIYIITDDEKKTYEAPVSLFDSKSLVIIEKYLL